MLIGLAIIGAGFLSAIGWYGANAYVIDPYLKKLPIPPAAVTKQDEVTTKPMPPAEQTK